MFEDDTDVAVMVDRPKLTDELLKQVEKYARRLATQLVAYCEDDVQEYISQAYEACLESLETYDPLRRKSFKNWCMYVVRLRIIDWLRDGGRSLLYHPRRWHERGFFIPQLGQLDIAFDSESEGVKLKDRLGVETPDFTHGLIEHDELRRLLAMLPQRQRLVMRLYWIEELCMREIGDVLNMSEANVSLIHSAGMTRLKEIAAERVRKGVS
jgi:RNA polymerase sigma factor (sigma-70 family)